MCEAAVLSLQLVECDCVRFDETYSKQEPDTKYSWRSVLFPRVQRGTSLFKSLFFLHLGD